MTSVARSLRSGTTTGTPVALVLAVLAVIGCHGATPPADETERGVATVVTAPVARGAITATIETIGTAEFDPEHLVATNLLRSGQVTEVAAVAGQAVKKGVVLVSVGPVPAGSLEAQKARIDVEFAERELARTKRLIAEKLATNQDLQNAERDLASNRAVLAALGAGAGGEATVVRAPSDGIVAQVLVRPGALVQAGQEAVTLAANRAMIVRAGFEVEDVARLAEGTTVALQAVYAAPGSVPITARLSRVHAIADPATQLVEAIVELPDPPPWLVAGMRLHVRAEVASAPDVLGVPREGIVERDGQSGAFVVAGDEVHWRRVDLGIMDQDRAEIVSGLRDGDVIVTTGRTALADGMRVRVQPAPAHGGA